MFENILIFVLIAGFLFLMFGRGGCGGGHGHSHHTETDDTKGEGSHDDSGVSHPSKHAHKGCH